MENADNSQCEARSSERETLIQVPLGLLGFEHIKSYSLVSKPDEAPFKWFQAPGDDPLAFLVVNPFEVLPDYQPEISDDDVAFLRLPSPEEVIILSIVTLRPGNRATVNLKGPVVLNRKDLRGKQVILANAAKYALQHPLPTAE